MLDPIQFEFRFLKNTLADPEPEPGAVAGAETLIFRLQLQPKVSAPCGFGSGSTTLARTVSKDDIKLADATRVNRYETR
jgi:hypothetical protein